ncbi:hypothetical protein OROMI_023854 [Orobanche minor]
MSCFFEKIWDKVCISGGDRMKVIMKVDEVIHDNIYRCWGHIIKAVNLKSMWKESSESAGRQGLHIWLGELGRCTFCSSHFVFSVVLPGCPYLAQDSTWLSNDLAVGTLLIYT